jgi:hypothetical protein
VLYWYLSCTLIAIALKLSLTPACHNGAGAPHAGLLTIVLYPETVSLRYPSLQSYPVVFVSALKQTWSVRSQLSAKMKILRLVLPARALRAPHLLSFLLEPALRACEALSILHTGQLAHTDAAACSIGI